jgi:hypothetical protein
MRPRESELGRRIPVIVGGRNCCGTISKKQPGHSIAMPTKQMIFLPAISALFMLPFVAVGNPATAVTSGGRLQLARTQTFPAVKLRGYRTS